MAWSIVSKIFADPSTIQPPISSVHSDSSPWHRVRATRETSRCNRFQHQQHRTLEDLSSREFPRASGEPLGM